MMQSHVSIFTTTCETAKIKQGVHTTLEMEEPINLANKSVFLNIFKLENDQHYWNLLFIVIENSQIVHNGICFQHKVTNSRLLYASSNSGMSNKFQGHNEKHLMPLSLLCYAWSWKKKGFTIIFQLYYSFHIVLLFIIVSYLYQLVCLESLEILFSIHHDTSRRQFGS